ncbi:MAG: PAS domain S-box protein [Candidatus Omnitrophota bacterium]|jgi:PAS domain S-box-containing protein
MKKYRVLIVEDNSIVAKDLEKSLLSFGYRVLKPVATGEAVLEAVQQGKPDLVLMDIKLKGAMDGIAAVKQVRSRFNIPVIYLTAFADDKILKRAKITGPYGYIIKPFEEKELKVAIEMALYKVKMEQQLKESEERYREIVEHQRELICRWLPNKKLTFVNEYYCRYFGKSRDELLGKSFIQGVSSEDQDKLEKFVKALSLKNPVGMLECRVFPLTGQVCWQQWIIHAIIDSRGEVAEYQAVGRDITESKKIEVERQEYIEKVQQLSLETKKHSEELDTIFAAVADPLLIYDQQGTVVKANKAAIDALGFDPTELSDQNLLEKISLSFVNGKKLTPQDMLSERALRGEVINNIRFLFKDLRGNDHAVLGSGAAFYSKDQIVGAVVVWHDITERYRFEELLKKSEERYRFLYEESHAFNIVLGLDERIKDINKAVLHELGYRREEVIGRPVLDFIIAEQREKIKKNLQAAVAGEANKGMDVSVYAKDNSLHIIMFSAGNAMVYEYGVLTGVIFTGIDITQRKKTEIALRKAHDELEVQVVERTVDLRALNKQLTQEISERKEIEKRIQISNAVLKLLIRTSSQSDYLSRVVKLIRGVTHCRCAGIRILSNDGQVPYKSSIGFSEDFWNSENNLSINTDDCICLRVITGSLLPQDAPGKIFEKAFLCNNMGVFTAGLSEAERQKFRGKCVESGFSTIAVIPIYYQEQVIGAIHLADEEQNKIPLALAQFIQGLTVLIGEGIHKFSLYDELQQTNEMLEKMYATSNFLIAYLDTHFNFLRVNQAFWQLDGTSPEFYVGKNYFDLFPNEENKLIFTKVLETGETYSAYAETLVNGVDPGEVKTYWDWSLQPVKDSAGSIEGLLFILVDVTSRKLAEGELAKTQKELAEAKHLSVIGMLAATVAHELRNPLGVIRTAAYNIRRKTLNSPFLESHLGNIEKKVIESDQIISNLLFYSRIKMPRYEQVNLCGILEECVATAKNNFPKAKVALKKNFSGVHGLYIEVDPLQIKEVFSNILNNAYQALPDEKGKIEVEAALDDLSGMVSVSFIDSGVGIDPENLQKLAEPFFTTKTKGTGLGLTVCYHIVNLHGGKLEVKSQKGHTVFTVKLPLKQKRAGEGNV